jgi:heme-degrading monooxygenase HmoA
MYVEVNPMPLVSVTRFRARSTRFVPLFELHFKRTIAQIRKAEGFLAGAVQRDTDLAFWTMTIWRDERAIHAYVASGAHRTAMPHLRDWGIEASVTRWTQDCADLPEWPKAVQRMRDEGRASKLRHPGPHHADISFPEVHSAHMARLSP